ncbi:MAG: hypothetical protein ACYS47_02830 [Planctomycetota bacterium]
MPLVRPGMKKSLVLEIMGEPNYRGSRNREGLHYLASTFGQSLLFRDGILVDHLEDLYRRGGERCGEVNKVRALQRLAEIGVTEKVRDLLDKGELGIDTARVLGWLNDQTAVPILLDAAGKANHLVSGSEGATIFMIYRHTLAESMAKLTGLNFDLEEHRWEGLEKATKEARKWWASNSSVVLGRKHLGRAREVSGLSMTAHLDRARLSLGELPSVTVTLRNTSENPVKISRHRTFYTRHVRDAGGAEVAVEAVLSAVNPDLPTHEDFMTIPPGGEFSLQLATHDEVIEDGKLRSRWRRTPAIDREGRYGMRVFYAGVDAYPEGSYPGAWVGLLETNPVGFEMIGKD